VHGRELLELVIEAQDRRLLYLCGAGTAWLLREQGDADELASLLGAIQQVREMMGIDRGRIFHTNGLIALTTEALRARLGEETFEAALTDGRSLSFQQIIALIRDVLDAVAQGGASRERAHEPGEPAILSPREQEVLRLVAEGRSNKQIAKELIIGESTVKTHVTFLFNKLGVDTRAQAVAVAAQRGLLPLPT
jgi:ATP/maltotriose-dependent transcriptional regulator MalT